MKRIALFFNRSYVDAHSCFTELVRHLSASGYSVDLYCIFNPYNSIPLFNDNKVRVFDFPRSKFQRIEFWYKLNFNKDYKYTATIGTPFDGIFLAQSVARKFNAPFFYLADEIFNPQDLERHQFPNYPELKKKDILANKQAAATIALGQERFEFQVKINQLPNTHKYSVIPNAAAGESKQLRSNYFRDIFNINDDKPILLFIGTLSWKLAAKLFEESKSFIEKPYHLVFHARSLNQMGAGNNHPFIKISKTPVDSSMLNYVVSSATIGLVLYDKDSLAETENALTGGKIGTYLKNNLPLIVGNYSGLKTLEQKGAAVFIDDFKELDEAVNKIMTNIDNYKNNIKQLYNQEYNYSKFYKGFETYLNELVK